MHILTLVVRHIDGVTPIITVVPTFVLPRPGIPTAIIPRRPVPPIAQLVHMPIITREQEHVSHSVPVITLPKE